MQVQRIQNNNNYNTSFSSKILGHKRGFQDTTSALWKVLANAEMNNDRTFLNAAQALIKDGKDDVYTFLIDKSWRYKEQVQIFNREIPRKETYNIHHEFGSELFRDVIVDIARQKGLISGKPIGTQTIVDTYAKAHEYPEISLSSIRKSLAGRGFKFHNPKSDLSNEEQALVKSELAELKNIKASNSSDKDKQINSLRIKIGKKISANTRKELSEITKNPSKLS